MRNKAIARKRRDKFLDMIPWCEVVSLYDEYNRKLGGHIYIGFPYGKSPCAGATGGLRTQPFYGSFIRQTNGQWVKYGEVFKMSLVHNICRGPLLLLERDRGAVIVIRYIEKYRYLRFTITAKGFLSPKVHFRGVSHSFNDDIINI